jgi:hypothetical protein
MMERQGSLSLSRGAYELALMALIDRQYLQTPYGSRGMAAWLQAQGHAVKRKRAVLDATDGTGGHLPAPAYQSAGTGASDLSVPLARV